jgi:hypothetical protein
MLVLPVLFTLPVENAKAINWEGKEDWLSDSAPFPTLTKDVPQPLPKALPSCEEREKQRQANSYNPVAIAGVNCVDRKK